MRRLLACCLVTAAVLPFPAAGAKDSLAFSFGRKGGTAMPFNVKIYASGRVAVTGAIRRMEVVTVTPQGLAALRKLTAAERFYSMPVSAPCLENVGGLATNYIRARIGRRDKTVNMRGGCNKRFLELFEVLKAVAGVSTTPKSP
jgi:hypothetical protein